MSQDNKNLYRTKVNPQGKTVFDGSVAQDGKQVPTATPASQIPEVASPETVRIPIVDPAVYKQVREMTSEKRPPRYRNKENPIIGYTEDNLTAFALAIGGYVKKTPELADEIDLSKDAFKILTDIVDVLGEKDTSVRTYDIPDPKGVKYINFHFEDLVDVLALESFFAFLQRLGFDIGDFDGEEWDTPGYASYAD